MSGQELFRKYIELAGDKGRRADNPRDPWQRLSLTEQIAWDDLAAWLLRSNG